MLKLLVFSISLFAMTAEGIDLGRLYELNEKRGKILIGDLTLSFFSAKLEFSCILIESNGPLFILNLYVYI